MKITLRSHQVEAWRELAELIGAKHPSDAVAYMGSRYLHLEIARLKQQSLPSPPEVCADLPRPSRHPKSSPTDSPIPAEASPSPQKTSSPSPKTSAGLQSPTAFDDLFDSIGA